jgi:hypothetical protein
MPLIRIGCVVNIEGVSVEFVLKLEHLGLKHLKKCLCSSRYQKSTQPLPYL